MPQHNEFFAKASQVFDLHAMRKRKVTVLSNPYRQPSLHQPLTETTPKSIAWPPIFQVSISKALDSAWAPSTTELYNRSIKQFLSFCSTHNIPDPLVFPASEYLLCAFIASLPRTTSKSTIRNLLSGLRAWHIRNGFPFDRSERLTLIARAERPFQNKSPMKPPVTLQMIEALSATLDRSLPLDSCILACALTAFWGLARLGELIPASKSSFNPDEPPFPLVEDLTPGEAGSYKLSLPWTKVAKWKGETLFITLQNGAVNPCSALRHHIIVNRLEPCDFLFTYRGPSGFDVLTKNVFVNRCNAIWRSSSLPEASGHSFRIGGTSHLLLSGINPDIIKQAGRWSSDSFLRYWRNLDIVIPRAINIAPGPVGDPRHGLGWGPGSDAGLASSSRDPPQGVQP